MSPDRRLKPDYHPIPRHRKHRHFCKTISAKLCKVKKAWLRVERIELTVFVDNEPAVAVYKKYGFEIEGTGKKYGLRNGEYVDAYFMARVK